MSITLTLLILLDAALLYACVVTAGRADRRIELHENDTEAK